MRPRAPYLLWIGAAVMLMLCAAQGVLAQLHEHCTVSVLNRTVQVHPDGSWVLPNVPANFGQVRARATCVQNGVTTSGESAFFTIPANGAVNLPGIVLGAATPIPVSLGITPASVSFTTAGQTRQLAVTATYPDQSVKDVTAANTGTNYTTSNPALVTVGANGLVTAVASGTVVIQATNDGAQGIITIQVVLAEASHGGIPDSWAIAHGLDPNNPTMPFEDPDDDGLTNLQEFQNGTDPHNSDTDGDGLTDGQEVLTYHTSPLFVDTDGDGVPDGVEVQTGTNPLDPTSFNYGSALSSLTITPANFVLNENVLEPNVSIQLKVVGTFIGTFLTADLTSQQRGTTYSTSDPTVCNFGSTDGLVFAGNAGSCTITVSVGGHTATAIGVVRNFTPIVLSEVPIPGFTNGIDVAGNFAYIAAGPTGLQVVNMQNRAAPSISGSVDTPGNAEDVKVVGNFAYVADGTSGLQIIDVSHPASPVLVATFSTSGEARALVIRAGSAYVAASAGGLQIIDVSNPLHPALLGSFVPSGGMLVKGVDVDLQRHLAVLVGGSRLVVLDISDPTHPALLGSNTQGLSDARDLVLKGNAAIIADIGNGMTSYDLTDPTRPAFLANVNLTLGGRLNDIVVSGDLAFGADVFFANGVPIVDVSNPAQPSPRFILNFFATFGFGFDDDGHGIAVDNLYLYLVAVRGTAFVDKGTVNGSAHLYIGQYQSPTDNLGVPPTAAIVSPVNGDSVILGSTLHVSVNASDDVGVAGVTLYVNGQIVSTLTSGSTPYEFTYAVPANAPSSLSLVARAIDFGNNVGTSNTVTVSTIPDPLTTAIGIIVDKANAPVGGATVTCLGVTGQSGANGAFSIPGLPTIQGAIWCSASLVANNQTLLGTSAAFQPIPGGITNVGQILIGVGNILLLADVSAASTNALVNALTTAGNTVTVHTPEYTWDTTNPPLTGFNCVVHLDGATFDFPLPSQSQTALEDFVNNGGGFIASQWDGYERAIGQQTGMPDLVLQLWLTGNTRNCNTCNVTYQVVPGQGNHPVLASVPSAFTFFADGHDAGAAVPFTTHPSTVLMTIPTGGPAVLVRQFGNGRVVNFSWAPNYVHTSTLLDPNVQLLYTNAAHWACQ